MEDSTLAYCSYVIRILILVLNATHLRRVLLEYINDYYNVVRPYQGIEQRPLASRTTDQHRHCPTSQGAEQHLQRLLSRLLQPFSYSKLRQAQLQTLPSDHRISLGDIIRFLWRSVLILREYLSNQLFPGLSQYSRNYPIVQAFYLHT